MTGFAIDNSQWREQLSSRLPAQLRSLLHGTSGRDLLAKVDTTIVLLDGQLLHVEAKQSVEIEGTHARAIALGCAELLSTLSNEQRSESALLLLLPANFFAATTTTMPGVLKENLVAALKIQADSILPSLEEPLALAINPESANEGDEHLALWMTESVLSDLFKAFDEQELFLAAVKPRFLNYESQNSSSYPVKILDVDSQTQTCALVDNAVLKSLLHIPKRDLEQAVFQSQWDESIALDSTTLIELSNPSSYFDSFKASSNQDYSFFPRGALTASRRSAQGRQYLAAGAAVAAMLFLAAIPFLLQSLEFRSLAADLEMQRSMAQEARQDQAVVVSFENDWGLISDFPEQRINDAMFTLQNILRPDTLSSLEVADGLIKIQGSSSEPQAILQRLEQDPMFTEVVFSRATNNSRYYIDLRLSTVNFEGYMVRYFPDE